MAHRFQPLLAFLRAERFDRADHRAPDRADADEAQDALLEAAGTTRMEPEAIDPRRHAHRDDAARATPLEAAAERLAGVEGKAGPQDLLQKALQRGRQRAE